MITSTSQVWRIYLNLHGAAPLIWCVSNEEGTFEMLVKHVDIKVHSWVVYRPKQTPDSADDRPSGWLACVGVMSINERGCVTIEAS